MSTILAKAAEAISEDSRWPPSTKIRYVVFLFRNANCFLAVKNGFMPVLMTHGS
jgi:hypothetical protein